MDIELLFSMSPLSFLSRDDSVSSAFSYISATETIELPNIPESNGAEPGLLKLDIPENLKNCNLRKNAKNIVFEIVVFYRGGYLYQVSARSLAEGARSSGLKL